MTKRAHRDMAGGQPTGTDATNTSERPVWEVLAQSGDAEGVCSVLAAFQAPDRRVDVARADYDAIRKAARRRDVDTLDALLEYACGSLPKTYRGAFLAAASERSRDRVRGDGGVSHVRALAELCHGLAGSPVDDSALAQALKDGNEAAARFLETCYFSVREVHVARA